MHHLCWLRVFTCAGGALGWIIGSEVVVVVLVVVVVVGEGRGAGGRGGSDNGTERQRRSTACIIVQVHCL